MLTSFKMLALLAITIFVFISIKLSLFDHHINNMINKFYQATVDVGLKLENVYLEGQINLTNSQVLKSIESEVGDSILKVDVWDTKRKLENIDWVLSASVARELPDTIHIRIVERTPIAIWQHNYKQYLIDDQGHMIVEPDLSKFIELPVVVGEGARSTVSHLIQELNHYPKLKNRIVALIRISDRRWDIRIKNGPEIKLPENNIDQALKTLIKHNKTSNLLSRNIEVIDMRVPGKIFYKKKAGL